MRSFWLLLLAGCVRTTPVPVPAGPPVGHPELVCPQETEPMGHAPPHGLFAYCGRLDTAGVPVRHGPSIAWYDVATRSEQGAYYEGERHGPWQEWYPTGRPRLSTAYIRGVPEGPWTAWHASGQKESEGQMQDGRPNGHWAYWNEAGIILREGTFTSGVQDGIWVHYGLDGQPRMRREYRDGRLVKQVDL